MLKAQSEMEREDPLVIKTDIVYLTPRDDIILIPAH